MSYRSDIDGLRAVAVLFVLVFHAFPRLLSNGFLGVDVFFVISGYVITGTILSELENSEFSFINFYCRRIKKIFPPALVVLYSMALVGGLTLFAEEFSQLQAHIKAAALFILNYRLLVESDYFDISSLYKPTLHFWSLSIEKQFYVLWPFLLVLFYKFLNYLNLGDSKKLEGKKLLFFISFLLLLMPSVVLFFLATEVDYYSSHLRVWELLTGCLVAIYLRYFNFTESSKVHSILGFGGIALICSSLFIDIKAFAIFTAVCGAGLYIISGEHLKVKRAFKNPAMVFIGLISYPLYLWHWPLLSFYRIFTAKTNDYVILALVLLSFLLATMTYVFIEKPLKEQSWDLFSRDSQIKFKKSNLKNILISVSLMLLLVTLKYPKLPDTRTVEMDKMSERNFPIQHSCPVLSNSIKAKWCMSELTVSTALLWGDSHAHALYAGMLNAKTPFSWQLISEPRCPPFLMNSQAENCLELVESTYKSLLKNTEIKVVVLTLAQIVFEENRDEFNKESTVRDIAKQIQEITNSGKKVIIIKPVPEIAENINNCLFQRFSFYKMFDYTSECQILEKDWLKRTSRYSSLLNQLASENKNVTLIDPADIFCVEGICNSVSNGFSDYRDEHHLSITGNTKLAKAIMKAIESRR